MPLALLLQDTFGPLIARTRRLAPWADVGDRLALVGQRMRTAYLVRWFGAAIPTRGNALRVSLVNLRELLAKAAGVRALQSPTPVDAGMAGETMSGVVGALAGMTFAPPVQIIASIRYLMAGASKWYLAVANLATLGGVTLAGAALTPVFAATVPKLRETTRALAGFYAAVTDLAGPLADFWRQLTGPRGEIRNPVLRALLDAADGLAKLIPQLFGAAGWLLTRVAPRLPALARAIRSLGQLIGALGSGIVDAVDSLVDPLRQLFAPATGRSVVAALGLRLVAAFAGLGAALRTGFTAGADAFLRVGGIAGSALTTGWDQIKAVAEESIVQHPITKIGDALVIIGDHIGNLLRLFIKVSVKVFLTVSGLSTSWTPGPLPPASPPSPPWWPPFPVLVPPALRPWSAITTGTFDRTGMPPNPLVLRSDVVTELYKRPPSVFSGAVAETARRWKDTERVRAAAISVLPTLRSLLPAAAAPYLSSIGRALGEVEPRAAADTAAPAGILPPVKALPPSRLRPRVRMLEVRVPAATGRDRTEGWITKLRGVLDAAPLPVPAVTE